MFPDASYWINHLKLSRHIEGGWFSEVYQSQLILQPQELSQNFNAARHCATHIYFLLEKDDFSALHRIKSDELWHFYAGDPLIVYEIQQNGKLTEHLLGQNADKNQQLFTYIKAGNWFGARLQQPQNYALVGCTVSPGFNYEDFELGKTEQLIEEFPQHRQLISSLTR